MNINWYGQTCFKIISQKNKDGQVSILIDPVAKDAGFKGPKIEADIILFTNPEDAVSGNHFPIVGPGEYEIKEVYVKGVSIPSKTTPKNVIYCLTIEDIKMCHLGKIDCDELAAQELEEIGDVDILMIPIGDKDSLDSKAAIKIMSQIEPKITIPMYYQTPKIKEKLDGLDIFLKALGVKNLLSLPKLSIKKKDISEEDAKVVALEC